MGWVGVITIDPHAAGLDGTGHLVGLVGVAGPHASAEPVDRVVGDLERLRLCFELDRARDRSEDLFLEDPHVVGAGENRRLDVIPPGHHIIRRAAGQHLGALCRADVDVVGDALMLLLRHLRAHHRAGVERVAQLDRLGPLDDALHEPVIDVFLHQQARIASANLPLVEREEHGALDGLVQEGVVRVADGGEEELGALATELKCRGDHALRCRMQDARAGGRRARECQL
mmetsp:Transcript_73649/g.204765  ORF Transcript_73649/g.204765 Transcript_73649/m.204765 type:complete len:229 (+) Transcript_73649:273-959(+)